jgi:predicted RNase H-like HicB family nuclease
MKHVQQLTAIIEREGDAYVGLCPEVDIASQGDTIEAARKNLQEAVELFFETADRSEIERRQHSEVFVTRLEVEVG